MMTSSWNTKRMSVYLATLALIASFLLVPSAAVLAAEGPVKILFMGDRGHHEPAKRFPQLKEALASRGIEFTYTENLDDFNKENLAKYDGCMIFANQDNLSPDQEAALIGFVEGGKGLIPLHCASFCYRNSKPYIAMVGAQFQRHGTGTFRTTLAEAEHPILKGYSGFESWDETYVHHMHNEKDRTILEYRVDSEGREPWTWVRNQGKGRVFYTAWGHDGRTWSNPGFHNLVERGILWAVGRDVSAVPDFADQLVMTNLRKDVKPFEYVPAKVPQYLAGEKWGTLGENISKMQKPLEPEESAKHLVMPQGFTMDLFATEPQIGKPLAVNWDHRGRLWICESIDYPNELRPRDQGRDRIRICEDTDGDGKADKFTIFAEKLSIPTGLTFARGGVIVCQAPDMLFLKDTNGDDVADEKTTLFTGWDTGDTHAGPSNLQYGFDNWIYGIVGYAGFRGTVGGEEHNFRQCFYRFRPDGSKLEVLRNTNNNSWGVSFSEEGVLFGSTANGNPSEYMPIPNRYYEKVRGWSSRVLGGISGNPNMYPITKGVRQVDHHGHFTAAAGHALYTARNYPSFFWNKTAFVAEPTGHLVALFQIHPEGAGYRSTTTGNLVASDDEWTAPTMAEVGPDGNVWVVDWYNFIVQHNPIPAGFEPGKHGAYETPLRDKTHGRIYRLVYGNGKKSSITTLADATPAQLVEALKSDNLFWRRHAQRLLVERANPDVVPALVALLNDTSVDAAGISPGVVHALWTLDGLGQLKAENADVVAAASKCLTHPSAAVRRTALTVLPRSEELVAAIVKQNLLHDKNGQVALAAMLALSDSPASEVAGKLLAKELATGELLTDNWLADALTSAAAQHDALFLSAAGSDQSAASPSSDKALQIVGIVSESLARSGNVEKVAKVLAGLPGQPNARIQATLAGLTKGWPKDKGGQLSPETDESLKALVDKLPAEQRGSLVLLGMRMGSPSLEKFAAEVSSSLLAKVQKEGPLAERLQAASQLIDFGRNSASVAGSLLDLVKPQLDADLAKGIMEAVSKSEAAETGGEIVARIDEFTPEMRGRAIRVLLTRGPWAKSLVEAIEGSKVQLVELALDQKQALSEHPDRALAKRAQKLLSQGGGLPSADRQKVLAEFMPVTMQTGDADVGKQVFVKQCAKCHQHGELGNKVGPNLTGMAVHPKAELLTHILDPNRSVEGTYRVYTVQTGDGLILQGLLASESKTAIELFDAEGKKHQVLREDIETLKASPKSLMPEGFEKQVTKEELTNLLEFLTKRGKYLPLSIEKVATATSTKGMFINETADAERLIFPDWTPKTVDGIPFQLIDPQGTRVPNVVLLRGPKGTLTEKLPTSVTVPCNGSARAIHMLSGVSGWGFPYGDKNTVSMIVRITYEDGKVEDHPLRNGEHFADYIREVDVPKSKLAFRLRGQQIRYLAIFPQREAPLKQIELVKGPDTTAPVVMAITLEGK